MNKARKIPVFFHIPKNAGTFVLNRLFAYGMALNKKDHERTSNKRIHILNDGDIAYRLIVFDLNDTCNTDDRFNQVSERLFEIDIKKITQELIESFCVFALVVTDISFNKYEEEIFPFMPKEAELYKLIPLRDAFSRAVSIFNYSNSKKSSHEKIHGLYKDYSLEEYLRSGEVEESWLIRKLLGLSDDHYISQKNFNEACKILDDFEVFDYKDSQKLIENFFLNFYNFKQENMQWIFDLWCPIYNKNKKKSTCSIEDFSDEVKELFLEKTFWDNKLYKKYKYIEKQSKNGKIVNCFYNGSTSGFGDFLRGSIHLYNHCKSKNLDFDVDISNHPIKRYFNFNNDQKIPYFMINDYQALALNSANFLHSLKSQVTSCLNSTKKGEVKYIFSNLHQCVLSGNNIIKYQNKMPKLNKKCSEWFQNKFTFCKEVEDSSSLIMNQNNIKKGGFDILHFRLGDIESFSEDFDKEELLPRYKELLKKCLDYKKENKKPTMIISDSNHFKEYIKNKTDDFIIPHLKSNHTQQSPCGFNGSSNFNEESLFHTALDMKLLSSARNVESRSIYYHGSGFAFWICKIHNVPFKMKIIK